MVEDTDGLDGEIRVSDKEEPTDPRGIGRSVADRLASERKRW